MEALEKRYRDVCSKIPRGVVLLAVSKGQAASEIEALYRLGHRDFGENYAQEMLEKAETLRARGLPEIRWHFIGHLQTNKVKALLPHVYCIHSVDSLKLARELAKRWKESGRQGKLPVFIEVNQDDEPTKSGFAPTETGTAVEEISRLDGIELLGLMSIPGQTAGTQAKFAELRQLNERVRAGSSLSMGMSGDFEQAIVEGATHVRVGTYIFGPRPAK